MDSLGYERSDQDSVLAYRCWLTGAGCPCLKDDEDVAAIPAHW